MNIDVYRFGNWREVIQQPLVYAHRLLSFYLKLDASYLKTGLWSIGLPCSGIVPHHSRYAASALNDILCRGIDR
jgi:hypothetical protein